MKHLFVVVVALLGFFPIEMKAGELILAVLQFPSLVEQGAVMDALAGEDLRSVTDDDRFNSKNSLLRGTPVLFSQRLMVNPGASFGNVTRYGTLHSEVQGKLDGGISVQISLSEGVQAGIRRFSRSVYRGAGKLERGRPAVLSFRQVDTKQPSVVKGKTKMISNQYTIALVYQFLP